MIKKLLGAILFLSLAFANAAPAAHVYSIGILSKLNMTQEEFQSYMNAARGNGNWTLFSNDELKPMYFVFYDSLNAMLMGLNSGEADEAALPETVGEYFVNVNPDYKIAAISLSKPVFFAFGFRKEEQSLRDKFNSALMDIKADGTIAVLKAKYIIAPGIGEPEPVKFETYDGAETIKVAVTGDLPPIDFIAADGTPAGFNTAVLAEIGKRLHINVELLNIDSGARAAALSSGRADVVFWFQVYKGDELQPDVPAGIAISESYYDWTKYLHIKKK